MWTQFVDNLEAVVLGGIGFPFQNEGEEGSVDPYVPRGQLRESGHQDFATF